MPGINRANLLCRLPLKAGGTTTAEVKVTSVTRDRTARNRVRTLLATKGDIEDRSGYATAALKDAVGYTGSSVAFIQLLAAMESDQEISREVRGRRTYRIALGPLGMPTEASRVHSPGSAYSAPAMVMQHDGVTVALDYDRLARALVRALLEVGAAPESEERAAYLRELESARTSIDELLAASARQPIDR